MQISCALCPGKMFDNLYAFRLHCTINHPGCHFQCAVTPCKRSFDEYDSFRKHMIREHGVAPKPTGNEVGHENCASSTSKNNAQGLSCSRNVTTDCVSESPSIDPLEAITAFIRCEIPSDLESKVIREADILVAKLCSKMSLPRSAVTSLINDFKSFLSDGFIENVKGLILSLASSADITTEERGRVNSVLELLQNPFDHLSSEYLRMKYFTNSGDYIPPESYVIESRMERITTQEGVKFQMKEVTGQHIPLRKVFEKLFELPHALEDTIAYKTFLSLDDKFSNFSQCDGWKRKVSKFPSDALVFPVMVYYDDFEPNNVLGPHCEKLGCCYVSLPLLPPECQSRLENIFLALLFNAEDRRTYGNAKTFRPLVKELEFLETEGITVKMSNGSSQKIFFVVGLALGDNLGLNGMCGFVESFSANFFCRVCKASKIQTETMLTEDVSLLRTSENYLADVMLGNPSLTGIKELCFLEEVSSFETPEDIGLDPFHDLNEGVCHYTMVPVLQHFNRINPSFLENLNDRMYLFEYGIDSDNKPPNILPEHLNKNKLKMTGAEMHTFVRLFGVLIGDLVDENDPYWQLYLLLNDIVTISMSKRLPKDIGPVLELLVKEHNQLYSQLTGMTLKPKHHLLTHYNSRILYLFGPLALLSTIRFEARHKLLKLVANVCSSRRNLPLTVAIKQQLLLCYRFICNKSVRPEFVVGSGQVTDLRDNEQFPAFSLTLPNEIFNDTHQFCAKWVDFCGTKYKQNMILFTGIDEVRCPSFSKIELILIHSNEPLFVISPLYTLGLNSHIRGYEVKAITNQHNWFCISHSELLDPFPMTAYVTADGDTVIVPKHLLLV